MSVFPWRRNISIPLYTSIAAIHAKNLVSTLYLLVALATHYGAPARLPNHVHVNILVVQKRDGILHTRQVVEEITGANDGTGAKFGKQHYDDLGSASF